jgi:hypothetical protein
MYEITQPLVLVGEALKSLFPTEVLHRNETGTCSNLAMKYVTLICYMEKK